ncbi:hypothetical protein HBI56_124940 [Parastagonospora nodorum]|nr:hypothetical protein HBH53_104120 [Parastagonospora nodorum]KAH3968796.1 hypothetical protein HBH51_128040 [Parastagonospora nodorum]KAH3989454.1 hypothetical protein HBH52_013910 [Parastagonospora nodorum]KAH4057001.1 hypothetical protein HBH49_040280 [Parastagonospora nodorum]KAH4076804.1 hypothetical protein HBH50_010670 [Parastagonospora nodorum]
MYPTLTDASAFPSRYHDSRRRTGKVHVFKLERHVADCFYYVSRNTVDNIRLMGRIHTIPFFSSYSVLESQTMHDSSHGQLRPMNYGSKLVTSDARCDTQEGN